ncbi:MAG: hypothetical protein ACRES9_02010 [Gammaproteobacteria bacterium]
MEFLVVIGGIVAAVALYFFFGIALRFLWGWGILVFATPACVFFCFAFGWWGAIVGIIAFFAALWATNEWHDSSLFLTVGAKIDKVFYLGDT